MARCSAIMAQCRCSARSLQWFLAILALSYTVTDAEESCPQGISYRAEKDRALLFGGVYSACASGCQPRNDEWSQGCNPSSQPNPFRGYAVCHPSQTAAVEQGLSKLPAFADMQDFSPCQLYSYLQGRTLWVMGDSLMRNYYYALRCFMLDFWDHSKGECAPSSNERILKSIYKSADTNITSSMGSRAITDVPRCVHLIGGGRICWVQSVRGEEFATPNPQDPGILQRLQHTVADKDDIFLLNFGRWHYTNCRGLEAEGYRQALKEVGELYQKTRSEFPNWLFKTSTHDHTACREGKRHEVTDQCIPAVEGGYPASLGQRINSIAESILGSYSVPILDTYQPTIAMHEGHILYPPPRSTVRDCLHYCSPGIPEFEIFMMARAFVKNGIKPLGKRDSTSNLQCLPVTEFRPPAGWSYYLDMISRNQSAASPAMAGAHAAIDVQQQQQLLEPELQEQVL